MAYIKAQLGKDTGESLKKALGAKNDFALPKISKIVVNMGIGKAVSANLTQKEKTLDEAAKLLGLITGQKPAPRRARQSIAGFKVREGDTVGYVVTLHGRRMADFLERLFNLALPRSRDFRGIPLKNIDARGNLTFGIREHIVFPEVAAEETKQLYGFEVTLVPTTRKREQALALYRALGIPLEKV